MYRFPKITLENIKKRTSILGIKGIYDGEQLSENILNLYLSTSIPVNKIAKEFDIDESRIYQLLKEKNITKRRYNLCIKNI